MENLKIFVLLRNSPTQYNKNKAGDPTFRVLLSNTSAEVYGDIQGALKSTANRIDDIYKGIPKDIKHNLSHQQ